MKNDNNTDNNNPNNSKLNNKEQNGQPFTSLREPTPELKEELSNIMASPKKKFLILGLLGLLLSYLLFYFFVLRKRNPTNTQVTTNEVVGGVTPYSVVDETPGLPSLPAIPKIEAPVFIHDTTSSEKIVPPTPPLPPIPEPPKIKVVKPEVVVPPVVVMPSTPTVNTTTTIPAANPNDPAVQRAETKRKSGIMLMSGKPPEKTPEEIKQDADFTQRGNTCLLLPRGKIIEAVIETSVSTDFGGEVRALITRDVYAASGNRVLIPKGSVALGKYETGFDGIYARIKINWFRIDLANNNYSINISSPSVDNLGREGITGNLDNRYKEKLGNVILTSAFDILLAKGLDKLIPPVINSSVATANQALASQLNNIALGIYSNGAQTPQTKISLICAQVQAVIPDKTSQAFISFATTCNNLMVNPGTNPQQTLDSLMAAVSSTSASLIANVTTQVTPTQAQQASKQAFIDIAHTLRELTTRELPKATVTIDQGTHVKIYVNKDYNFPATALSKVVRLK